MRSVKLLVVDLDGTVREGKDDALGRFVNDPGDVRVFPEAAALMQAWREDGGRVLCVTNQGGIALGHLTVEQLGANIDETSRQLRVLAPPGAGCPIDAYEICVHHPDADDPEKARCWCRKPSPGLVIRGVGRLVARFSGQERYPLVDGLMVGDRPEDEMCARMAGLDFMWAAEWRATAGGLEQPAVGFPVEWRTPPLELERLPLRELALLDEDGRPV